jgi:hypothetical protein
MYILGKNDNGDVVAVRLIDGNKITSIPVNPDNTDYQAYLKWVAEGNVAQPAE